MSTSALLSLYLDDTASEADVVAQIAELCAIPGVTVSVAAFTPLAPAELSE